MTSPEMVSVLNPQVNGYNGLEWGIYMLVVRSDENGNYVVVRGNRIPVSPTTPEEKKHLAEWAMRPRV